MAANHSAREPKSSFEDYQAHGFFSDDHGELFQLSQSAPLPGSNESTAAELSNDKLLLNSRNQRGDIRARIVSISTDGGLRWDTTFFEKQLPDPICEGSILNIGWKKGKAVLAFSNPASTQKRDSLSLRISWDEGRTWTHKIQIDKAGGSGDHHAYSDLVLLRKNKIGVLYERSGYSEIVLNEIDIPKKK